MPVTPKTIVRFLELVSTYLEPEGVLDLAEMHDLSLGENPTGDGLEAIARRVVRLALPRIEHGDNRHFIEAMLEQIDMRNTQGIATSRFERRDMHEEMAGRIHQVREDLGEAAIPRELTVEEGQEFTAKAEVRDFFGQAEDDLFVVDPYVGVVTLDCFRSVTVPIRVLTGTREASVEDTFEEGLAQFREEGFEIDVRRHDLLHDRHAILNDRCFLIGSSLKHAGRKQLNIIEFVDSRHPVIEILEAKWSEADTF